MNKGKYLKLFALFGLSVLLFGCATTGPGGKRSLILISTEQEVSIGQSMAKDVESQNKVADDSVLARYVNGVGQKIAQLSDRTDLSYHFKVLQSPEINAFACPGGFIYVYSGLLKTIDNEAQLAGVLSHEIGHVVARHSVKRLQQVLGIQVLLSIALGESSEITQKAIGAGVTVILQGYSRQNEFEADYDGAYYMTKAGYYPEGMIQLFGKFQEMEKGRKSTAVDQLLASHPATVDRIARVEEESKSFNLANKQLTFGQEEYQKIKSHLK
ncbi:MAG: M48 family metallopeptidase [Candidatus Zixiibacteriota bacterium]